MSLPEKQQKALDQAVARLKQGLGEELESLVLYGSAVRGTLVHKVSDLNLLILLKDSRPKEHAAIARALDGIKPPIQPFVLGRRGFDRSRLAFAVKFQSIGRNYRVLHGNDPLQELKIPVAVWRFLAEQALRNFRLRFVHGYVVASGNPKAYSRWLVDSTAPIFTTLCEPMRIEGASVLDEYAERVPGIQQFYDGDASVLLELLALRAKPRRLSADEILDFHSRLFGLLDRAVHWTETKWPASPIG